MLPLPDEAFSRGDSRLAGTAGGATVPGDGAGPTGCRGRMVELVAGAGELVLQALFSRETILKQANQIGVEYVDT